MRRAKIATDLGSTELGRAATNPEDRENQLIALAYDLVEKRIREGTASAQETTHFLKMGCSKASAERKKLELENELLKAKTESLQSQKVIEELYTKAIKAMQKYSGNGDDDENIPGIN